MTSIPQARAADMRLSIQRGSTGGAAQSVFFTEPMLPSGSEARRDSSYKSIIWCILCGPVVSTSPEGAQGKHRHGLGSIEHQGRIVVRAVRTCDSIRPVVRACPSRRISAGIDREPVRHRHQCGIARVGGFFGVGKTDRPCRGLLRDLRRHGLGQFRQAGSCTCVSDAGRQHRGAILDGGGGARRDLPAPPLPSARATTRLIFGS